MKFVSRKELKERLAAKNMWCTWFKMKLREYSFVDHFAFTNLHDGYLRISYDRDYYVKDDIQFDDLMDVLRCIIKGFPNRMLVERA